MQKCYIYSLSCPISKIVRYVGRTTNIIDRYNHHLWSVNSKHIVNDQLYKWVRELLNSGLKPEIGILQECEYSDLSMYEKKYIDLYITSGHLLNKGRLNKLHDQINYNELRAVCKNKKIKYKIIADALNVSYCSVAGYLTGQTCQMNLEKAKLLKKYIESY